MRGAADVPLNEKGQQQVEELAQHIQARGGLDRVYTSPFARTSATAAAIHPTPIAIEKLGDMAYGKYEGHPSAEAIPAVNDYIKNHPNVVLPGTGAASGKPGESFDAYRTRVLGTVQDIMRATKPEEKIGIIMNRRTIKTVEGWLARGAKPDLAVDAELATSHKQGESEPGDIWHMQKQRGKWKINKIDTNELKPFNPGIYLIRHGLTAWNGDPNNASKP